MARLKLSRGGWRTPVSAVAIAGAVVLAIAPDAAAGTTRAVTVRATASVSVSVSVKASQFATVVAVLNIGGPWLGAVVTAVTNAPPEYVTERATATATARASASAKATRSATVSGTGSVQTLRAKARRQALAAARRVARHKATSRARAKARAAARRQARSAATANARSAAQAAAQAADPLSTPTLLVVATGDTSFQPCGGPVTKPDGTQWQCSFDDEFSGTALDPTKWFVQTTAASGFHSGPECFMDSPDNIQVSNGTLKLIARKESSAFTCTDPKGNYATQYTSGTVNGYGKFSQTYGRFEVRAKVPSTTIKGLQETLWLWPVDQFKYGAWPASGEIDFAEFYTEYQGWNVPTIHYYPNSPPNWTTNTNVYTAWPYPYNQPGMTCTFNPSDFNTYTVLWQPGRITLQVNHQNCIVDNYLPSNVSSPAPFDQPFFIALTQALGIGSNAFVDGSTPLPATTEVDYVRIWS